MRRERRRVNTIDSEGERAQFARCDFFCIWSQAEPPLDGTEIRRRTDLPGAQ